MTEALAFTAAVAAFIWLLPSIGGYWAVVLLLAVVLSFRWHAETYASAGLARPEFFRALRNWKVWWAFPAAAIVGLGWGKLPGWEGGYHAMLYCAWCVLQQFLFQNMVCKRLREASGPSWKNRILAGSLFGAVHLPNPVLTPATVVWGTLSGYLFEELPSVVALGLMQFLLSTSLLWLTPLRWNHDFRVGPGYWRFH
jgi:hypothetical protein